MSSVDTAGDRSNGVSSSAPPVNIDQTVSDFDGVTFHISTPDSKTKILVSIQVKCFNELVKYGAQQVLEREYGPYVVAPENGYNFSVQVDLDNLPDDKGNAVILRRNMRSGADIKPAVKKQETTSSEEYHY